MALSTAGYIVKYYAYALCVVFPERGLHGIASTSFHYSPPL